MDKKVTMKQIAEKLNISINAVSLALNNRVGVSEETRKKILRIADEMGYLDQSDRYNQTFSSKNICVLMRKLYFQDMHFYSRVIYGIEREADRQGYDIIMQFTDENLDVPACVINQKVSGVIIVGQIEKERVRALKSYGVPLIFVDTTTYGEASDSVLSDNRSGTFQAGSLLVENGYKRIGFFGDLDYSLSIRDRFLGYTEAYSALHETVQDTLNEAFRYSVLSGIEEFVLNHNLEGIIEKLKQVQEMPQAFMCSNDRAAVMLMNALRRMDYRVPEDIGIVGFDDVELSTMVDPGLTTLHIAKKNMGMKAVNMLQWRISNRRAKPETVLLPVELIIRGSVLLDLS